MRRASSTEHFEMSPLNCLRISWDRAWSVSEIVRHIPNIVTAIGTMLRPPCGPTAGGTSGGIGEREGDDVIVDRLDGSAHEPVEGWTDGTSTCTLRPSVPLVEPAVPETVTLAGTTSHPSGDAESAESAMTS